MEKLYTISKTTMGTDCVLDHELLIAKFRLNWKKVGKPTRPFRQDLNKVPYNYTVVNVTKVQGIKSDRQSALRTMD